MNLLKRCSAVWMVIKTYFLYWVHLFWWMPTKRMHQNFDFAVLRSQCGTENTSCMCNMQNNSALNSVHYCFLQISKKWTMPAIWLDTCVAPLSEPRMKLINNVVASQISQRAIKGIDEDFPLNLGAFLVAGLLGCLKKACCAAVLLWGSWKLMHVVLGQ